jgi:iron complex outermembrane receptor protein
MKWLLHCLLILIAGGLSGNVCAQVAADTLEEVGIRTAAPVTGDAKAGFQQGAKVLGIDSALLQQYRQQTVATLLSQVSSVFIKSYGFNSLATLSFRGASSAQSAVYWEGVPLMNGATGITDVSLLPVAFSDSVSIQYGSGGALWGSGNVGGALMLAGKQPGFTAKPAWRAAAQVGWGSFAQVPASAEIGFTSGKIVIRARGLRVEAANDFPAADLSGRGFTTENAALFGEGLLLEATVRMNTRNTVSLHAWHQAYRREIPRALFEASSAKQQDDKALRFMLNWKRNGRRNHMYAKAAFLQDRFSYSDPDILLKTASMTDHFYGEWGMQGRYASAGWIVFVPIQ